MNVFNKLINRIFIIILQTTCLESMKTVRLILGILFLLPEFFVTCKPLYAQQITYTVRQYTTENGLANNQVKSIARDKNGFLWIATFDGLSRFDGSDFVNYFHDPKDSNSIPAYDLLGVLVDSSNNLWITNTRWLCRFDRKKESFHPVISETTLSDSLVHFVEASLDSDSILWILTSHGLAKFDPLKNRFVNIPIIDSTLSLSGKLHCYLRFDNLNRIWFIKDPHAIYQGNLKINKDSVCVVVYHKYYINWPSDFVNLDFQPYIYADQNHTTWLMSCKGLFRLDAEKNVFTRSGEEDFILNGNFDFPVYWSEPGKGIFYYYPDKDTLIHFYHPDYYIIKALYSNQNLFWFGGLLYNREGVGLNRVCLVEGPFTHYLLPEEKDKKPAVFGLIEDTMGVIWAGLRGEEYLIRISPSGKIHSCNFSDPELMTTGNHPRALELVENKIWVGYLNNYAYWFDPYNLDMKTSIIPMNQIISDLKIHGRKSYRLIKKDLRNNVILGGNNQLTCIDPFSWKILKDSPFPGSIYSFLQDNDSTIWIGGMDFIMKYDKDFTTEERIQVTSGTYNIEAMADEDTVLWLALMGGGIGKFHKQSHRMSIYSTRQGLSNNIIYDMLKDRQGRLWMGTNKGISMFNPVSGYFRNFGVNDGLLIEEFNSDAAYQCYDGRMIFGGMGGVVAFYPDSVMQSNLPEDFSLPMITEFRASGNIGVSIPDIYQRSLVHLPKGSIHLSITFVKPDLLNAEKLYYRYRMSGVSDYWTQTDSRHRYVRFTGLKPGSYIFELQATDINGNWGASRALMIRIPSYFYQTWWFLAMVISIGLVGLFAMIWMWRRQVNLREQRIITQLKLDTLRNQLNPHFLFNSLNSINYFIANNDQLSANRYVSRFSQLMRSILTNSAFEYIPLEKELEALEDYCRLEHLRFQDKFDYLIKVNDVISVEDIEIAPTMVQPFVENAIWHGVNWLEDRKGYIEVRYESVSDHFIRCTITDDGIGRKASAARKSEESRKRRSRGLAIIRERLEMVNTIRKLNLSVKFSDLYPGKEESGTVVTIEIPIQKTTI